MPPGWDTMSATAAFIAGVSAASAWKIEAPMAGATSSSGSPRRADQRDSAAFACDPTRDGGAK